MRLAGIAEDGVTLTLNRNVDWKAGDHIVVTTTDYGAYYIDTTQDCESQGNCPVCTPNPKGGCDLPPNSYRPSVFLAKHTYYVYFIFARYTMHQTYDIYIGDKTDGFSVSPVRAYLPGNAEFKTIPGGGWITTDPYDPVTQTVRVTVDLTNEKSVFQANPERFCQPNGFCAMKTVDNKQVCGCDSKNAQCKDDSVCAWGQADIDCPMDPDNSFRMGCYGFSFTMPQEYVASHTAPSSKLFRPFTSEPYFEPRKVVFTNDNVVKSGGACDYTSLPTQ